MTVLATTEPISLSIDRITRRRKIVNGIATSLMVLAFVVAVVPLAFLIFYVGRAGLTLFNYDFLITNIPIVSSQPGPGMAPAVVGTLLITAAATLMAAPLGILGAVYLNEYGKTSRLANFVRLMTDVMTGVPSIVMGLFVYTVWVLRYGLSGLAGAIALACLMLPVIVRTSEEMLKLVPSTLREASAALGVRTWKTTIKIVLPAALPGIVSGVMLAVARAAGETAPLLFTIGIVSKPNSSLFGTNTALSAQIFKNAQVPFPAAQDRAWAAALTLILLVFILTMLARLLSSRFAQK